MDDFNLEKEIKKRYGDYFVAQILDTADKTYKNNSDYIELNKEYNDIIKKHKKVREVYEDRKIQSLNEEEVKLLLELSDIDQELDVYNYKVSYMMGLNKDKDK